MTVNLNAIDVWDNEFPIWFLQKKIADKKNKHFLRLYF